MNRRPLRLLACLAGVASITFIGYRVFPVNATTVGFVYLLLLLIIASSWGFLEAALSSVLATLLFNFFFLPPVGTLTIADPQNWVALFTFLVASLIASRLSAMAKRRASEAIERQQDLERLYTFSRAILLIGRGEPFPTQLIRKLADTFELSAAALYECGTAQFHGAGSVEFDGLDHQLLQAALQGKSSTNEARCRTVLPVRLGAEPIASLAVEGVRMPDSVLQGIVNLVAIGLERARAQDLEQQVEAARQSEQLRTTLIDAMAHEFKTPLTLIKATTTALLDNPDEPLASRHEQLTIADEEADRLRELIDDAVEMARLDSTHIAVHLEHCNVRDLIAEVVASMQTEIEERPFEIIAAEQLPAMLADRRLLKLAIKQLVDNALKYSPPEMAVMIGVTAADGKVAIEVTDHGAGIPVQEQPRVFERFYRSPSVKDQIPGSGLGLSIAHRIATAHNGDLSVKSRPGETTFRMTLPASSTGENR